MCSILTGKSICDPNQPIIVCEENNRKYIAHNSEKKTVGCYRIDGGIITCNDVLRCDFLVCNYDNPAAYFVELKGKMLIMRMIR